MKLFFILLVTIFSVNCLPFEKVVKQSLAENFNGNNWAVLVAGSNGYYNYRHQADICHAYQILHKYGIPDERIIVMMYDDIAYNEDNPRKGVIINRPGGPNVYPGVLKDYTGSDVTPDNFLDALSGSESLAEKGKKVVKSGPNDHIFVYFSDHGAPGLIAFPDDDLHADKLNKVLKKMYKEKKYGKMVIYIEACESGSMFENILPKNINIYATTAANSEESSYACYYDDQLQTYLGDVYSVKWMENSDSAGYSKETLEQQYQIVKKETNTSHVMQFGNLKMGSLPLTQFQGSKVSDNDETDYHTEITDAIPSPDVPLVISAKKAMDSNCQQCMQDYELMLSGRKYMNETMMEITKILSKIIKVPFESLWSQKQSIEDHECYFDLISQFKKHCFNYSKHQFGLRFLYVFVNFCNSAKNDFEAVLKAKEIMKSCEYFVETDLFDRIL